MAGRGHENFADRTSPRILCLKPTAHKPGEKLPHNGGAWPGKAGRLEREKADEDDLANPLLSAFRAFAPRAIVPTPMSFGSLLLTVRNEKGGEPDDTPPVEFQHL